MNEDELTIRVCSGGHSWSFLVILAMTMTITINSNSVLLIRVASAGRTNFLNMFKKFVYPAVPSTNTFHSWLCVWKMCSYLLCCTAYVLYSSHSYCIRGCSNCILLTMRLGQTIRQCELRRMELQSRYSC